VANFPGSAPVAVNVSVSPAAGMAVESAPAPAPASAPATVSEALAPPVPAADRPVLPQGVVDADAPPESTAAPALDANPYKTAATMQSQLVSMGVDPALAQFGAGRVEKALAQPALSPEQMRASQAEVEAALDAEFGDDAEAIRHLARQEVQSMAKDYPDLIHILERTNLGNDLQVIKMFASRGHEKWLAGKRAAFGLPAR
jgi:hypothetical protein